MIKFGPAGNDNEFFEEGNKTLLEAPEWIKKKGLDIYEISFGHGIIVNDSYAVKLKENLDKSGIEVSIHAPYYINFANPDEEMGEKSINYVLNSLKILKILGGKYLVIHSGTQLKLDREEAMNNILKRYRELIKRIYELGLDDMYICPETMGKFSQIGNVEEILRICKEDKILIPTLDFGHINSVTNGSLKTKEDYNKIIKRCYEELGKEKTEKMHIHFSKIQYGAKGEIKHLTFEDNEYGPDFEPMIDALIENNISATVICESSGTMAKDAKKMKDYYMYKISNGTINCKELEKGDIIQIESIFLCRDIQKVNLNGKFKIKIIMYDYNKNIEVQREFKDNDKVQKILLKDKYLVYCGKDNENGVFINTESENLSEKYLIKLDIIKEQLDFISENSYCIGKFNNDELVDIRPLEKVNLKVEKVERKKSSWEVFGTKNVMLETGVWINVPLEIVKGDIVTIDTKMIKFLSKVE